MNIAFYIESLNEDKRIEVINQEIARNKEVIENASIFYNNIGPLSATIDAGVFHVSDMWSFEGVLVIDNIQNLKKAKKIVNKFKCWYYYDKQIGDNLIDIINLAGEADKVIANGEIMANEYERITNTRPDEIIENYQNIARVSL